MSADRGRRMDDGDGRRFIAYEDHLRILDREAAKWAWGVIFAGLTTAAIVAMATGMIATAVHKRDCAAEIEGLKHR